MNSGHELAMALRAAYWSLHRRTDARLKPHGVSANQFVLLALLRQHPRVTQRELVEWASSDANTIRAMLVTLQNKGLVQRIRHPQDGRAWCVSLTTEGDARFERLWAEAESVRKELLESIPDSQTQQLIDLLHQLVHSHQLPDSAEEKISPNPEERP